MIATMPGPGASTPVPILSVSSWAHVAAWLDGRPTPEMLRVMDAVCEAFGVTRSDLTSRSRKRYRVDARHATAYLAKQRTNLSLERIGLFLGGRDHTTIIHGANHAAELIDTEPSYAARVAEAVRILDRVDRL